MTSYTVTAKTRPRVNYKIWKLSDSGHVKNTSITVPVDTKKSKTENVTKIQTNHKLKSNDKIHI
jgi:hypothetical protein